MQPNIDLNCNICGGSEENKAGSSIGKDVSVCVDWLCCDTSISLTVGTIINV